MVTKFLLVLLSMLISTSVLASCYDEFAEDEDNFISCKAAAESGDSNAQYILANLYNNGQGVEFDDQLAVEWYKKSAEQNNDLAQYSLGIMYEFGEGDLDQDEQEAKKWYRLAADNGNYFAQNKLGLIDMKAGDYQTTITPYSENMPQAQLLQDNQTILERLQGWFSNFFSE